MQNKTLFWASDIHLNFLHMGANEALLDSVLAKVGPGNALVVTGDIAEAPSVQDLMEIWKLSMEAQGSELYFILGNHDFYNGSIENVRDRIGNGILKTNWLPTCGIVELGPNTALVGHDGWYDGGYDDWFHSRVDMNDYYAIKELGPKLNRQKKFLKLQALSQEAADHVYKTGSEALKTNSNLIIATHVPPFREAAVHDGKESDPDWMPHFSSKRMGDAIRKLSEENPLDNITVLCGHTHGEGTCQPLKNVVCYTSKAEYYLPEINKNSFEIK